MDARDSASGIDVVDDGHGLDDDDLAIMQLLVGG
jgi:hypothetical protein